MWQMGLDVGNDSVKLAFRIDPAATINRVRVPNSVTAGLARRVLQAESDPYDAMDVTIQSDAVGNGPRHVYVGNLASAQRGRVMQTRVGSHKAREAQTYEVGLATMAVAIARSTKGEGDVEAEVKMGTVLPEADYVEDLSMYTRAWKGRHRVKLETVPGHEGRTITLRIPTVQVLVEGAPALIEEMHAGGGWRDNVRKSIVSVVDLGALTADCPTFNKFKLDNNMSDGYPLGFASFLDSIAKDVAAKFDVQQLTRADLVRVLFEQNGTMTVRGVATDIRAVAEPHIDAYTQQVARLLMERWDKWHDIEHVLVVGGATDIVRDRIATYLPERYSVHFAQRGQGVWANAIGCLRTVAAAKS